MQDDDVFPGPGLLLRAYRAGIFPMAGDRGDTGVFWVNPEHRGVLPLERFHVSRSLGRRMRRAAHRATLDRAFATVVEACAARDKTWISRPLNAAYLELHATGHAHSLEIWAGDELAGGVFGVTLGGAFFGESMFSHRTDGSKMALAHLADHLRRCGFTLFDTQFLTPHLARLGAIEISRHTYLGRLAVAVDIPARIDAYPLDSDPAAVVHRITQTS